MIMKRILFLLCLFVSIYSFSQTEISKELFPTLAGLQRTSFYHWSDDCSDSHSTLDTPTNTITINDKLYVNYHGFYLREENNQVLVHSSAYNKDLVLYDWTLEIGDSLSQLAIDRYSYENPSVVDYLADIKHDDKGNVIIDKQPLDKIGVKEISYVTLLDGKAYKKWVFDINYTYVDGIGSFSTGDYFYLILQSPVTSCYLGQYLICVSRYDQLLYTMEKDLQQQLGAACQCLNEGIETDLEINITTPTPSSRKTLHNNQLLIQHGDKTYNVMGVEVGK